MQARPDQPDSTSAAGKDRSLSASGDSLAGDRYLGFSLQSVCWGYRDIFEKAIESLFAEGLLGPDRQEITTRFFEILKNSNHDGFDHISRCFLDALSPANRWLLRLPALFYDLTDLGLRLSHARHWFGESYFRMLGEGRFGGMPEQVRACLTWMRRLLALDAGMSLAFLENYHRLLDRLLPGEIELYVNEGARTFHSRHQAGLEFFRSPSRAAETYIMILTQECRLADMERPIGNLVKALSGTEIKISDLGGLDSDDLLEHGTNLLCLHDHLFLPVRLRHFPTAVQNRNWYLLAVVCAAGMLLDDSFARIHGHPQYRTCCDLVGDDPLRLNMFVILEYVRVLRSIRRRWPGACRLIEFGLQAEFTAAPSGSAADRLLHDAWDPTMDTPALRCLRQVADDSINCFDAAQAVAEPWTKHVLTEYSALDRALLRPVTFLSDFRFPVSDSDPPPDRKVLDLKQAASRKRQKAKRDASKALEDDPQDGQAPSSGDSEDTTATTCFLYDEWDHRENDYRQDYCQVREVRPAIYGTLRPPPDLGTQAARVRRLFERLRPDLARREKYLCDGIEINEDLLTDFLVQRSREPSPRVRFYERPIIRHRDLAVQILLDISGSTGCTLPDNAKVLDVEKQAAIIFGEGLATLGDRFAVSGFSSDGRERCHYASYKEFDEPWSAQIRARIHVATPCGSTRMGPALRHSGYRLSLQPCRQRLILLITDGKPMDSDYDPDTRYAQHDVRMACEENTRKDIHTFAISTQDNALADMEIMFPRRRFVILPDIRSLPRVLPQLYLRLTL